MRFYRIAEYRVLVLAALCALYASPLKAQAPTSAAPSSAAPISKEQRLARLVEEYHKSGKFDGAALVLGNGQLLLKRGYGLANREWGVPNTPSTRFNIASLAKSFTAILILQLYQEGKLQLDDALAKHLPEYPAEAARKVTLRHLLTHTSGIPNYEKLTPDPLDAYRQPLTLDAFIVRYGSNPLEAEPGTRFNYNNVDYILLTKVIERVSGQSWAQVIQEKILGPLHMRDTGCVQSQVVVERLASGYTVNAANVTAKHSEGTSSAAAGATKAEDVATKDPPYHVENYFGAGAMYSTVDDLLRLDAALRAEELLSMKTKELMYASNPQLGYVALGSWVSSQPIGSKTPRVSERYGNTWGFHSSLVRFLDEENTIILLTNSHRVGKSYEYELKSELARILYEGDTP